MSTPLHVLIVEDSEDDSLLLETELARGGYEVTYSRVETAEAMRAALAEGSWDIILSDHRMPQFSSQAALKLYKEHGCDIPFIVVSGSIGEELAVAAMKAGAHDYIMKDNLARLVPAVQRELREAETRRQRKEGERALEESNRRLQKALRELQDTQQKSVEQERLRALGQMASGVAHDFNNALSKILGFTELLLTSPEKLQNLDTVREHLRSINTVARDAAQVVGRLREFYRPRRNTEQFKLVDLNAVVEQSISLTEPKWRGQVQANGISIEMRRELQPNISVLGEEAELREALTNLIFNAVDAMPRGGAITIRTSVQADQALLQITDTGAGMTEEVRRRCFEPFFTTKGDAGTGLGLASVYGIVQRHTGEIQIQSQPGKGSTFSIRLPAHSGPQPQVRRESPPEVPKSRRLNVLVVEDEPMVRRIEAEYLTVDGHLVETAADGCEGLSKFRAGKFDLVLVDRAMPEINGDQLTEAIKELAPDVPVILVTGFEKTFGDSPPERRRADLILCKPFSHASLREAIGKAVSAI
jgi:signal transduction histidine kinase